MKQHLDAGSQKLDDVAVAAALHAAQVILHVRCQNLQHAVQFCTMVWKRPGPIDACFIIKTRPFAQPFISGKELDNSKPLPLCAWQLR